MTTLPGITGSTPTTSGPAAPAAPGQVDKDTFLKLLVAQLKYQDPSKPVDSSQFIAQSAQFTMVEKLEELASAAKASAAAERATTAGAYLGRSVTGTSDGGMPVTGVVTAVDVGQDGVALHVGDTTVQLASVTRVALPAATVPTNPTTTAH